MRIDVTVNSADQIYRVREQANENENREWGSVEVRYMVAPTNLSYNVPFPIVSFASGDVVMREYGEDAVRLLRRALSGEFGSS